MGTRGGRDGERSTDVCPRCGAPADQKRFCDNCGLNLTAAPGLTRRRRRLPMPLLLGIAAVVAAALGAGIYFGFVHESPSGGGPQTISDARSKPVAFIPKGRDLDTCLTRVGHWRIRISGDGVGESHADGASPPPHSNPFQLVIYQRAADARAWENRWRERWARRGIEPEFTLDEIPEGHTVVLAARFPLDQAERAVLRTCIPGLGV
jgi:zinc-ribbon domain